MLWLVALCSNSRMARLQPKAFWVLLPVGILIGYLCGFLEPRDAEPTILVPAAERRSSLEDQYCPAAVYKDWSILVLKMSDQLGNLNSRRKPQWRTTPLILDCSLKMSILKNQLTAVSCQFMTTLTKSIAWSLYIPWVKVILRNTWMHTLFITRNHISFIAILVSTFDLKHDYLLMVLSS